MTIKDVSALECGGKGLESRTQEVEAEQSEIQGHPQLHIQLQVHLGHMPWCVRKKKCSGYNFKSNNIAMILEGKTPLYKQKFQLVYKP